MGAIVSKNNHVYSTRLEILAPRLKSSYCKDRMPTSFWRGKISDCITFFAVGDWFQVVAAASWWPRGWAINCHPNLCRQVKNMLQSVCAEEHNSSVMCLFTTGAWLNRLPAACIQVIFLYEARLPGNYVTYTAVLQQWHRCLWRKFWIFVSNLNTRS